MMKKFIFIAILFALIGVFSFKYFSNVEDIETVQKPEPIRVVEKAKKERPNIELPKLEFITPEDADLDDLTKELIGLTGDDLVARNGKVWELRKRALKKADFEAIYAFLKKQPENEGANLELHSLKNDLLVFVIDDGRFKESTAQLMLEIVNDPYQHEVMKEYTLQYFSDYFEKNWLSMGSSKKEKSDLTEIDQQLQSSMIDALWKSLDNKVGPVPGTALIKLNELSNKFSAIEEARVKLATERMISDQSMPDSSRMAALSIATERQMTELSGIAQKIAFTRDAGVSLRLSALHTASLMAPDKDFIEQLQTEFIENKQSHKLLKRAAQLALKRINRDRG